MRFSFVLQKLSGFLPIYQFRCQSKLGRRRPFILALSILAMIGMTLLSFAVEIGELFDGMEYRNLIGLIVAITGSQLMDWGLDSTETPAKAYTLDCIQNLEDQVTFEHEENLKILHLKGLCVEHPNIIHRCWRRNRLSVRWYFWNGRQSKIILCCLGFFLRFSLLDDDFI